MGFTKDQAKTVGSDIEAAIAPVLAKHGLALSGQSGSYGDALRVTIEMRPAGQEEGEAAFGRYAPLYGIPAEKLGAEFRSGSKTYRLTGINPRATSMPMLARGVADGKTYKFTVDAVKRALGIG